MEMQSKLIGDGGFGNVYEETHQGKKYALKKYRFVLEQQQEWTIHKQLQHKNIVTFIDGNKESIMMEMMKCDLLTFVQKEKFLHFKVANCIMKEIVNGVKYMHDNGFVHRDLKLDNILIGEAFEIKICDFGYTEKIDAGFVNRNAGTEGYMAPELQGFDKIDCKKLKKADLFSLGVIYFAMMFGCLPYKEIDNNYEIQKLIKLNNWSEFWKQNAIRTGRFIPQKFQKIIQGLLQYNPVKRISLNQVLAMIGEVDENEYKAKMMNSLAKENCQTNE